MAGEHEPREAEAEFSGAQTAAELEAANREPRLEGWQAHKEAKRQIAADQRFQERTEARIEKGDGSGAPGVRIELGSSSEERVLDLAGQLGSLPPAELPAIRSGLNERGLLVDEAGLDTPQGVLTDALQAAEQRAGMVPPAVKAEAKPEMDLGAAADAILARLQAPIADDKAELQPDYSALREALKAEPKAGPAEASEPHLSVAERNRRRHELSPEEAALRDAEQAARNAARDHRSGRGESIPEPYRLSSASGEARMAGQGFDRLRAALAAEPVSAAETASGDEPKEASSGTDSEVKPATPQAEAETPAPSAAPESSAKLRPEEEKHRDERVTDKEEAYRQALEPSARPEAEASRRFARLLESPAAQNEELRSKINDRRRSALETIRAEHTNASNKAVEVALEAVENAHRRQNWSKTIRRGEPGYEGQATAQRQLLHLEPTPFLEVKTGGLFHRKDKRGPKMVESYFHSPDDDNLMVVERRNRRTGELVSQTVMASEKGRRSRRGSGGTEATMGHLPPRGANGRMEAVRRDDNALLKGRTPWRDYLSGRSVGQAIDGDKGVYAKYGASRQDLDKLKRNPRRFGGLFYALTGNRS